MSHLKEGTLVAMRDGAETMDEAARGHLATCAACAEALEDARARVTVVTDALAALDTPAYDVDMEEARARVRGRVARQTAAAAGTPSVLPLSGRAAPASRTGFTGLRSRAAAWGLTRAAGLLLVTAAAVSALPGSPVRAWIGEALGAGEEAAARTEAIETAPEALASPAAAPEETGVRLSVPSGALRMILRDVAAGAEIRVRLVPGTEAAVFAPAGSRFTSAEGRVEASVTPGEVRIELPRGVDPVSIEVGGRTYLRSTEAGLDVPGPVVARTADEIVFQVPRD